MEAQKSLPDSPDELNPVAVAFALWDIAGPWDAPDFGMEDGVELWLRRSSWSVIVAAAQAWLTEHRD